MENIFSSGSSIYYPCWQTAWCGCGTGFADVAVGTCPGICSSMRVSQSPSWWPQPWWEFPLWSPPTTRYLSSSGNKSSWIWYQCRLTPGKVLMETNSLYLRLPWGVLLQTSWIYSSLSPHGLCRDQIQSIVEPSNMHFCSVLVSCPTSFRLQLHL